MGFQGAVLSEGGFCTQDPAAADLDLPVTCGPSGEGSEHHHTGLTEFGPRQVQPDSTSLSGVSVKDTVPAVLGPSLSQQWDSKPIQVQGCNSIPSQGVC